MSVRDLPTDYQLTEVMFDRPVSRDPGTGAWDLRLFYTHNGAPLTVLVRPSGSVTTTKDRTNRSCTSTNGIDLCVTGPQAILDQITVLGLDESTWRPRLTSHHQRLAWSSRMLRTWGTRWLTLHVECPVNRWLGAPIW